MKAKDVLAGTKAEKPAKFVHPNGEPVDVLVRPITQLEEADCIAYAMEFAKARGLAEPDYGSSLFQIGMRAKVVSIATLDPDSPPEAREPFFPSVDFVVAKYHPEHVIYLHQQWKLWQDQCSPLKRVRTPAELVDALLHLKEDDDDATFFSQLSPLTQATCMRFSAAHALSSPTLKSFLSSATKSEAADS